MKKLICFLLGLTSAFALASCDLSALMGSGTSESVVQSTGSQEVEESVESGEHKHSLNRVSEVAATCKNEGNITHWTCECGAYFADAMGMEEISAADITIAKKEHNLKHTAGYEATCISAGKLENWYCLNCKTYYADEACTEEIKTTQISLPKVGHDLTHYAEVPVVGLENGVKEHWVCGYCDGYFLDAEGTKKTTQANTILYSPLTIPDFLVEVPVGREPVVLQLTDTQIIDAGQLRPGDSMSSEVFSAKQIKERCFDYLTETINATKPDLIILTGDIVYGRFDDNGTLFATFVEFMDTFQIPWAPIFGNHDNESAMGVEWQCEQFANAEYCLFERNEELSGNGNYSVGIVQGGEVKRVFYMLDTHACGNASDASKQEGSLFDKVGFQQDQIDWYTEEITRLKKYEPDVKISFAYHIQNMAVTMAYNKYLTSNMQTTNSVNIDLLDNKENGDFGYIGYIYGEWDHNGSVHAGLKQLGVDSIFVGHEHSSSASVVVDGIRYQFGQKSSEYDAYSWIDKNGEIVHSWINGDYANTSPLIGGSVIVLSEEDGTIEDAYIYYCADKYGKIANGEVQWASFMTATVSNVPEAVAPRKKYV